MDHQVEKKRILIADSSNEIIEIIEKVFFDDPYIELQKVSDGQACLNALTQFKPHLLIVDLTLPLLHGIELLKRMKERPSAASIGVIISTWKALSQDYQSAIESGADYYLLKPFSQASIKKIVDRFFEGTLKPAPFPITFDISAKDKVEYYLSSSILQDGYIKIWGSRGSIPVSGANYLVFGGNTPCLEIRYEDTLIIIDAGTGIRPLGQEILKSHIKEIHLVIGHTHWDHILGFPFFNPVYSDKYLIHIYAAKGFGKNVEELFQGMLDHDYFPVKLDEMKARFIFHDLADCLPISIGKIKIHYTYASHPGATLCFKIESPHSMIGYASDNEILLGYHGNPNLIDINHPLLFPYRDLMHFFSNCNSIIHEAQYTPFDYRTKVGWGHSSISNASIFIKHCKIKKWYVTHHDPADTDEIIRKKLEIHQAVMKDCNYDCTIEMVYDGQIIPL